MNFLAWIAAPLLLLGAAMLLADIGASSLWIAVIAAGIGIVALSRRAPRPPRRTR